jgi:hypothetical protein
MPSLNAAWMCMAMLTGVSFAVAVARRAGALPATAPRLAAATPVAAAETRVRRETPGAPGARLASLA